MRTSQNWIGPPGCTLHEAVYVPPPPFRVTQDLSELEGFIHADPGLQFGRRNAVTPASERSRLTIENGLLHSKAGFVSGTPIFVGSRVPLKNLFDYMAGGYNLDEFLADFPGVSREQAIRTLDVAREVLEQAAYETATR